MSLEALIKKCKKNNRRAQEALYKECYKQVMGICMRYCANKEEAEDCFQEAFIKIFNQINKLRDHKSFWLWMKRITIHTCIDGHRKKVIVQDNVEAEYELANDHYEQLFDKMETEEIIQVINLLPDGYKVVFNMYVIEGYAHKEIAEMLNIAVGTSKSQLNKAKALLNKLLLKDREHLIYEKADGK
ncbi:RNA polymerase sigma factor [Marivirga atlantica]|uniref:Sigma-70 family RNA polymerase sigma factor n=1 Tax=Marivirga atlantica TaxID=1548457 RepID=A0A937ABN1_9BACT|nr:sigma-70 family RNA polymerase sigma factor [Marivirga atlantica]MBL0765870.1 sigma-70 family RNA polymerase sigma factor [Marivirga atlantica]